MSLYTVNLNPYQPTFLGTSLQGQYGITIDSGGNLFFISQGNGSDGLNTFAKLSSPSYVLSSIYTITTYYPYKGIVLDSLGNMWCTGGSGAGNLTKITQAGVATEFSAVDSFDNSRSTNGGLLTIDNNKRYLYIPDQNAYRIFIFDTSNNSTVTMNGTEYVGAFSCTFDKTGNFFYTINTNKVYKIGSSDVPNLKNGIKGVSYIPSYTFIKAMGLTTDSSGNLYAIDVRTTYCNIVMVNYSTFVVTTYTLNNTTCVGICTDDKYLYVTDSYNNRITKIGLPFPDTIVSLSSLFSPFSPTGTFTSSSVYSGSNIWGVQIDGINTIYYLQRNDANNKLGTTTPTTIKSNILSPKSFAVSKINNNKIFYLDQNALFSVDQAGTVTSTASSFQNAGTMCIDHVNGILYIPDLDNKSVQRYYLINDQSNEILSSLSTGPCSVAVDSIGNLYVFNFNNVTKYNRAGVFISSFTTPQIGRPTDTNYNGIVVDKRFNIYISDPVNGRIRIYNSSGTLINSITVSNAYGLALDNSENLYAACLSNIYKFSIAIPFTNTYFTNTTDIGSEFLPFTSKKAVATKFLINGNDLNTYFQGV